MTKPSKKRLVVLDDDMDLLDELAAYFADTFEVDTFPGTPAALKALRDTPPDALLLDIDLEAIKGFDVLRLMNWQVVNLPTFWTLVEVHRLNALKKPSAWFWLTIILKPCW